ncbi:MAG: rod shape determining protein RodA [Candidatus Omnitrophota bacterium]|jgi:rod shape determining protein RodA
MFKNSKDQNPDYILLLLPFLVFSIGLFFLHSASMNEGVALDHSLVAKQVFWMCIAVSLTMIALRFHYRILYDMAWPFYFFVLGALILVLFMPARLGARRWIDLGLFNFQPSELAKMSVLIAMAAVMSKRNFGKYHRRDFLLPFIVCLFPLILVLKEPDLGTTLLFIPALFSMLFVAGFRVRWMMGILTFVIVTSPFLYANLKGYQKQRILTFLNPDSDPLGAGYTIIQSKIAIGSGGLLGKGLFAGSQTQLRFLPERHTDFIFSVIAEEGGFIAAGLVIAIYGFIVWRGFTIANRCSNRFGKLLATGISSLIAFQALVNISMTMGLIPVVGMPLFFISYGGSSAIVTLLLISILVNIGMQRDPFL